MKLVCLILAVLGLFAFSACQAETLAVPASVSVIEEEAFMNDYSLYRVVIPEGTKEIHARAFACSALEEIVLPSSLTYIAEDAFAGCWDIEAEVVPGSYAAKWCDAHNIHNSGTLADWSFTPLTETTFALTAYTGSGVHVVIPREDGEGRTLTTISAGAFKDNTTAVSIEIPETVTTIANGAFSGCASLTGTVYLPTGVKMTATSAFNKNLGTTLIYYSVLENGTVKIDKSGLNGPVSLELPDMICGRYVTALGYAAFEKCTTAVGELRLPQYLETMDKYAFNGCTGLTGKLNLPESLTSIGYASFKNCTGLTGSLDLPSGLTSIEGYAFYNCAGLTGELILPPNITSIGTYAFSGCSGFNGGLTLPDHLTTIGTYAFSGCSGFTGELTIPNPVTAIASYAFYNCTGFSGRLTLSESLQTVDEYAFKGCSGITALSDIYPACEYVAFRAFQDVPLTGVIAASSKTSLRTGPAYSTPFYNNSQIDIVYYTVLSGNTAQIDKVKGKALTDFTIPDTVAGYTVVSLGKEAFSSVTLTGSITFPPALRNIGPSAFNKRTGITGVLNLPSQVTTIGDSAFNGCTGVTGIVFPDQLTTIGASAFSGCTGLGGNLTLPGKVHTIGNSAFSGCTGIEGLNLPIALTTIGSSAFSGCTGLHGGVAFGDNVLEIGGSAFKSCSKLEGVSFGEGLCVIGDSAFSGCSSLTGSLVFPSRLMSIGASAFSGCKNLNGLYFQEGLAVIGNSAFNGCSSITGDLDFPDSLSVIGNSAFKGCTGLNGAVRFGKELTSIGSSAFSGLTAIQSLENFGAKLQVIGSEAFYNCSGLRGDLILRGANTINDYAFKGCGFDGNLVLPEGLTLIGKEAFYRAGFKGDLILPNTLKTIGESTFYECVFDGNFRMSSGVVSIGDYSFTRCKFMYGSVELPETLTYLGKWAFRGCNSLTGSLYLPDSITSIAEYAFSDCSGMNGTLRLPSKVTSIGNFAFYGCKFTGTLYLPNTLTYVGTEAFCGCSGFTGDLILPDHLGVSSGAFSGVGCDGKLVLPYYRTGDFGTTNSLFSSTRFSAVYVGPYMTALNFGNYGGTGWFNGFKGTKPIPLYYAGENPPVLASYLTELFGDLIFPWAGSPREADGEAQAKVSPVLALEVTQDSANVTENSQLLTITLTCSAPADSEGKTVLNAKSPFIQLSLPSCMQAEFLPSGTQSAHNGGLLLRSMSPGTSETVQVRVECTGVNPAHTSHSITVKAAELTGTVSASNKSISVVLPGAADRRMYADYTLKGNGTVSAKQKVSYDSTQRFDESVSGAPNYEYWEITIDGNLEITESSVTLKNTMLTVNGNIVVKDGGRLEIGYGSSVTASGNVDIGNWDIMIGKKESVLELENVDLTVQGKMTIHGKGCLHTSHGTIDANIFKFDSSSLENSIYSSEIIVQNELELNDKFKGKQDTVLHLKGNSLKCQSGAETSTLIVDYPLEKSKWANKLYNILSISKLVVTDEALSTFVNKASEIVQKFTEDGSGITTDEDQLDVMDYWELTYVITNGEEQDEWRECAVLALSDWATTHMNGENKEIKTPDDLYDNLLSNLNYDGENKKFEVAGKKYYVTVRPIAALAMNNTLAADGSLFIKLPNGKQVAYAFSMTEKGQRAGLETFLQIVQEAMHKKLSEALKKAAEDVPYIGEALGKAVEIYIQAVYEGKTWDEVILGAVSQAAYNEMKSAFPSVEKYLNFFNTVCSRFEEGKKEWDEIKAAGKQIFKKDASLGATGNGAGFVIDEDALVDQVLKYLQDHLFE